MSDRPKSEQGPDPRIAVLDETCDVEETERPFGKRWHQEEIVLRPEHLTALQEGKVLALDVREEYVVFLKLDVRVGLESKEPGYGG
ncbi:MAG: hypothetical protein QME77_12315 [bacterium]|nr:hypothetical protein [bacterium]